MVKDQIGEVRECKNRAKDAPVPPAVPAKKEWWNDRWGGIDSLWSGHIQRRGRRGESERRRWASGRTGLRNRRRNGGGDGRRGERLGSGARVNG